MTTEYLSSSGLKNLDYIQTGDLLLFKSINNRTSTIIRAGTRSSWTHVGIAIWEDGELKVFESSLSESVFDELTGTLKRGVRKTPLRNILNRYGSIFTRQVDVLRSPDFYTKLSTFIADNQGKDYTNILKIPFIPFLCMEDSGIHCSELTAKYLNHLQLFEDKPTLKNKCHFNFLPSDFGPENPDPEFDRLFTEKPMLNIYSSSTIESPSILFLTIISLVVGALYILLHLTK